MRLLILKEGGWVLVRWEGVFVRWEGGIVLVRWEGAAVGGWWCYISGAAVNNLFTLELYVSKHS